MTSNTPDGSSVTGYPFDGYDDSDESFERLLAASAPPAPLSVTIERSKLVNCQPGRRDPGWLYETTGPDGAKWDNRSIGTLRDNLRRRYGRSLVIIEPWNKRCANCHRLIFRARSGDWYHKANASVSCDPGSGSDRRAVPEAGAR